MEKSDVSQTENSENSMAGKYHGTPINTSISSQVSPILLLDHKKTYTNVEFGSSVAEISSIIASVRLPT